MVKRKLSEVLDELDSAKPQDYWQLRLLEMQEMLKQKKYSALARRIQDLSESNQAQGKTNPPPKSTQKKN
ncbi:MAG: hypothetical protein PHH08_02910 [Candidatus ainarchaeum sp.]|nr:hypothetical protein [Candidatus ainarchaeum sp.]